ncbi:MAG: hypothetical protein WB523_04840 [Candidatus Sulfotelmatobacter sp.]
MKKRFLILLLMCGGFELSAQNIVQQFAAISAGEATTSDMDLEPTAKGSTLIGMPLQLTPGVKVLSVTDNAPAGGNTYKLAAGARSSCPDGLLDIWYCENCNPGVTELQFHLSSHTKASLNSFLEVSNLSASSVLDGNGEQLSSGIANSEGQEVGPTITTTATDFIVARFFSTAPYPKGVIPAPWVFKPSYAYMADAPAGAYQPTLTGGKAGNTFCMSVAAFKIAGSAQPQSAHKKH